MGTKFWAIQLNERSACKVCQMAILESLGCSMGKTNQIQQAEAAVGNSVGLGRVALFCVGAEQAKGSCRGCQYASHAYVGRVKKAGLKMSMTEQDHSAENAMAERVNGILKQEYDLDAEFTTHKEARQVTAHAVRMYNNRRPHTALGYETPQAVHGRDQ